MLFLNRYFRQGKKSDLQLKLITAWGEMNPLKYYKYELLIAANDDRLSEAEKDEAERIWSRNANLYHDIFNGVSERIPVDIYERFSRWGFHDYQLHKVEVEHSSLFHMHVHVWLAYGKEAWRLTFNRVLSFQYDREKDDSFPVLSREEDNWMYEEFLPVSDTYMSLEVLFSSGVTLKVIYEDKNIVMEQLT